MRGIAVLAAIAAIILRNLILENEYDIKTIRIILVGFVVFFVIATFVTGKITGTF